MANLVHTFPTVFHITRIEPNAPQADSENRTNGSRFKGHINISATFEDCARDKALVFVDITETLQRFILSDAKYFAVFRPAGSGKSFMLSMFRYFFEHRALPPPPKFKGFFVNERRDDRQERLLEMNVAITKWPEWKSHLGTFHVLFFDFVTLSSTEPLLDFQEQLTSHLTKILWANPALGTATSEQERKNMHHILRILEQPLALDDLGRLVQWVVRILFDCTGIMTLVLIDHIEAPLVASLQDRINGPVRPCSDTTVRLLHQVIPAFSSSPHVHGLIAVGVYPFVFRQEHGIVTDCLNTTNSVFATACGFFENEVEELWKNRGESISQNELRNSIPGAKVKIMLLLLTLQ
ncbi:hypothetical protein DL96DRAFT_1554500 [Flagelloscypha sp. PMI_526]|nr:hypothetical protein DL96DRAFT_1554500 [Flagelloscypha sp. PMI_526]